MESGQRLNVPSQSDQVILGKSAKSNMEIRKFFEQIKSPSIVSQSLKDLSFALYMGQTLDAKYKNVIISDRNKKIVEFFSRPISQVNKQYFKQIIQDQMPDEYRALIKEIGNGKEPYVDHYGRVSYFYISLGGQILPVYQPGTIMFESAVQQQSNICIMIKDEQQNGPVCGNTQALFLARFMCKLVLKYNKLCIDSNLDSQSVLHKNVYKIALEQNIGEFCIEDMMEHGVLLMLKEKLVSYVDKSDRLEIKTLGLFQLRDFCGTDEALKKEFSKNISTLPITSQDAIKAMDNRQADMVFPRAKLIQEGGDNIDDDIDLIRDSILEKEGIVAEESKHEFRYFVKNCMSRQILNAIGGGMNSFSRSSFRLKQMKNQRISQDSDALKQQIRQGMSQFSRTDEKLNFGSQNYASIDKAGKVFERDNISSDKDVLSSEHLFKIKPYQLGDINRNVSDPITAHNNAYLGGELEQKMQERRPTQNEKDAKGEKEQINQDDAGPYNPQFMSSSKQALLVQDFQNGTNLDEEDEFLNDNELFFMQNLNRNEALLEYYHYVQEGLCSLFIQAKIVDGNFKIDGATTASSSLQMAGEIIPEVGGIIRGMGAALEWKNEKKIKEKLQKISQLIRDDQKNLIANYIASKLTIKRRTYLSSLTREEINLTISNSEKLAQLFDDSNVYKLKAQIDLTIIEAYILAEQIKDIQNIYVRANFAEIFADKIVKEFMGDVKMKQVDPPLKDEEIPEQFMVEKKFMVVEEYFTHEKYCLPPICRKLAGETEFTHQERVKRYLLACDDSRFSDIGHIINAENQFQLGFFNLYNEVMIQRIEMKKNYEGQVIHSTVQEKKSLFGDHKCCIF